MEKCRWLVGVAGLSLVVSSVGSWAQQTAPQAPASECSGLGCIFGSRLGPSQDEARAQALRANEEAARADAASGTSTAKAAAAKPAKPAHVITIAAQGPEVARLKRLAAALPKEKIKIVAARAGSERPAADFSVSTDLAPSKTEKARLFTEQMHVVAKGAVHALSDLDGKVVSFGPDKSAGQTAARKAFEALNIRVEETPLDIDNALDGLSTGDVDAVVMLAPQPIERLKDVSVPGVHLVSWPEGGSLPAGAVASSIDAGAYPSLAKPGETIRAMGVDATLNVSAKAAKQGATKSFLKALSDHSDTLTKRGFDLLKADLDSRTRGVVASADKS